MADFTVKQYGTDPSGRPIYMTAYMNAWWEGVVQRLGFRPTILQGAFMAKVAGGGATASAGFHDQGGCLDLWLGNLTDDQRHQLVHELRHSGAAAWVRNEVHGGFDEHLHLNLGTDSPLDDGAAWQWGEYIAGRDGLTDRGPDYHWRPDPLNLHVPVLTRGERIDAAIRKVRADIAALAGKPLAVKARRVALKALLAIKPRWEYRV